MSFARGGRLRHELYIDVGTREESVAVFERLLADRRQIEARYGESLSWEPLPGTQVCRVAAYTKGKVADGARHDAFIDWFIQTGDNLRRALGDE